ncbi:MAG: PAS domain-containing protein [Methylococcales bacterium]
MDDFFMIFQISIDQNQRSAETSPRITGVNATFHELLGYTTEAITGKPAQTLFFSNDDARKFHRALVEKVLGQRNIGAVELNLQTRAGAKFPVHLAISQLEHNPSLQRDFICIARNIETTPAIERALMESEERFRQMADMTGEWLWEQDPFGRYIYSSAAVTHILG